MSALRRRCPSCSRSSLALLLAPLLIGWVNQCRAWLQNKTAPGCCSPTACCSSSSTRSRCSPQHASPLFRAAPYVVFGCMVLAAASSRRSSTDLPLRPRRTRSRWSASSRWRACSFRSPRWTSARLRQARRAARDAGRLSRRAGAADGALHGLADPQSTSLTTIVETLAHREFAHLSEPRVRRRGVHDGAARGERAHAGRQPGDPPRAHDDPRGDDPRVFGAPSRADRVGAGAQAVRLLAASASRCSCPGASPRRGDWRVLPLALPALSLKLALGGAGLALLETAQRQDAHLPRARVSRARRSCSACSACWSTSCSGLTMTPLGSQLINLLAAVLLLIAFAMLSQRRILSLIHLFACRGGAGRAPPRSSATRPTSRTCTVRRRSRFVLKVIAAAVAAASADRSAERALGRRDADQHPDDHADRHRAGDFRLRSGAADLGAGEHDHPRHARHRAGERAALVPDDDHAAQGRAAGDRLPGDGERPVLRRDQRDLRHADGGRARHRARRAGRHPASSASSSSRSASTFDSLDIRHLEKLKED